MFRSRKLTSPEQGVALITGGASGIGRAVGEELGRRGFEVVLADRQQELAEEVAEGIRGRGGRARSAALDVTDFGAWETLRDDLMGQGLQFGMLWNNAGIGVGGEMHEYVPADWDDVFDVNLRGVGYGISAIYPEMIRQGHGHVVNTASIAGLLAATNQGSYTASKHAVVGLSKTLRVEAAFHGVRVTALCPGVIRTPILRGGKYGRVKGDMSEEVLDRYWESSRPMDVNAFAGRVVPRVLANEAIVIEPRWWELFWYLDRLSPTLSMQFTTRVHRKIRAMIARHRARATS